MRSTIARPHTVPVSVVPSTVGKSSEIRKAPDVPYALCEEKLVNLLSSNFCGFDTSSLMLLYDTDTKDSGYLQIRFLSMLEAACVQLDRAIFTSISVWNELERLSEHTSGALCTSARRALDLLRRLDGMGLVIVHEAIGKNNTADHEMLLLSMMLRPAIPDEPLVIFTQDQRLSEALLRHNHDAMIPGKKVGVYRIARSGEPMSCQKNKT